MSSHVYGKVGLLTLRQREERLAGGGGGGRKGLRVGFGVKVCLGIYYRVAVAAKTAMSGLLGVSHILVDFCCPLGEVVSMAWSTHVGSNSWRSWFWFCFRAPFSQNPLSRAVLELSS